MKKWYTSKTLWVNAVALVAFILQGITGKAVLDTEAQGIILVFINMLLRTVTKHKINWKDDSE